MTLPQVRDAVRRARITKRPFVMIVVLQSGKDIVGVPAGVTVDGLLLLRCSTNHEDMASIDIAEISYIVTRYDR